MSKLNPAGLFTSQPMLSKQEQGRTSPLVDSTPPPYGLSVMDYIKNKYNTLWQKITHPKDQTTRIMLPAYADKRDQYESEVLYYKQMPIHNSYSFTINLDPDVDGYTNCHKWQIPKIVKFFNELKDNGTINRLVFVYEYGKNNKVHFHGVIQFNTSYTRKKDREDRFEKPCLQRFNFRRNLAHRTLQYYKIKDQQHMDIQYSYMMKEHQNKYKCTYYI